MPSAKKTTFGKAVGTLVIVAPSDFQQVYTARTMRLPQQRMGDETPTRVINRHSVPQKQVAYSDMAQERQKSLECGNVGWTTIATAHIQT
eukprot:scaffold10085_cov155-Cylindrotheca_fusiformis.AAC.2